MPINKYNGVPWVAGVEAAVVGGTVEVGYTTPGASNTALGAAYIFCGGKFTAPNTGTITSIYLYGANTTASVDMKFAIYNDDSNNPTTIVATEVEKTDVGTWTEGWHEFTGFSFPVNSGSTYWIAVRTNNAGQPSVNYDSGGTGTNAYATHTYANAFQSPFNKAGSNGTKFNFKALLTY